MTRPPPSVNVDYSGEKIRDGGEWCFGIVCDLCGKRQVHHAKDIRRGIPGDFPVRKMMECWLICPRRERTFTAPPADCMAEFVTVDDGCSEEG